MKFIDLFCGVGGFHVALSNLGHECVFACDVDSDCRDVYKTNFGLEPAGNIKEVKETSLPDFDILCAGFPCQAFSHSGKQLGFEDETLGTLFFEICRILKTKRPKYFILENVRNLYGHDKGKTWKIIYKSFIELGYLTYDKPILMNPLNLGIPQNRERVFIVGVRSDLGELPEYPTFNKCNDSSLDTILQNDEEISKAIQNKVALSNDIIEMLECWEEFIQHFKTKNTKLPSFPIWTECWGLSKDDGDPQWKKDIINKNIAFYDDNMEWLDEWLAKSRGKTKFQGAMTKFEWQCGHFEENDSIWSLLFQFRPSGIRVKRCTHSPALVAMAQIVNIGKQKRKLTPRECARLQSFPENFKIHDNMNKAYKQFGNSVNVQVVQHIAEFFIL